MTMLLPGVLTVGVEDFTGFLGGISFILSEDRDVWKLLIEFQDEVFDVRGHLTGVAAWVGGIADDEGFDTLQGHDLFEACHRFIESHHMESQIGQRRDKEAGP